MRSLLIYEYNKLNLVNKFVLTTSHLHFKMLNVLNISILIILFIIITWSVYRWRNRIYFNFAQKLPSNKWQTLFGLGPVLHGKEIFSHTTGYGEKYGKNCVFWAGPYSFFITIEPQIIKEILLSEKCLERPSVIYNSIVILAGNGLLTENGELSVI